MNNTQQRTAVMPVDAAAVAAAIESVRAMASSRRLVLTGEPVAAVPEFPSGASLKRFRRRMRRVILRPTMRSANSFLRHLGDARVEYSEKEKAIRAARAKWREARAAAAKAREEYLAEKGDFYRG